MTRRVHSSIATGVALAIFALVASCGPGPQNRDNGAPELTLDVGSEVEYVAGEDVVQIRASATDPDGDALEFRLEDKPERATFQTFEQEALFTWRPIPSDVTDGEPLPLTFVVEDTQGAVAEEVVRLRIRAGNGLPQFQNSSSKLYDVTSNRPLSFPVEVRDDDSERVEIRMPSDSAPKGATFEQTDPKRGTFEWDPSPKQKNTRVHSVTFVADDMENDPVEQNVTIIFKNGDGEDGGGIPAPGDSCEDDRPIAFEPLPAQHTLEDYPIEATFSQSAAQTYDVASVLWTTEDPLNDPDIDFNAKELETDGTAISGSIPNLALSSGESETVFYAVCALDRDAPEDSEEKVVCSPDQLFHSFLAYSPDDETCIDDGKSIGSQESAAPFSDSDWRHYRSCSDTTDVHTFEVAPEEQVTAFVAFPFGQTLNLNVVDDTGQTRNDALEFSDCLGVAAVTIERDATEAERTYYIEVTGSDIPYQTRLSREGQSGGTCSPDDLEPNDSVGEATELTDNPNFDSLSICDRKDVDVFAADLLYGDVFGADLQFTHADGNLDATLFAPSESDSVGPETEGVAKSWSSDDGEQIARTVEESGTYHFVVFSKSASNGYTANFETTCRSGDAFSGNHTQGQAALPQTKTYDKLKVCGGEPDWYERTVFEGQTLGATLRAKAGASLDDVSMRIYNESGNALKNETRSGDTLEIDHTAQMAPKAQYFIRVGAPDDLVYSLEIRQQ